MPRALWQPLGEGGAASCERGTPVLRKGKFQLLDANFRAVTLGIPGSYSQNVFINYFRESTRPQNRQLDIVLSNSKQ